MIDGRAVASNLGVTQTSRARHPAVASLGGNGLRFDTKGSSQVVTLNTEQLSSRLSKRLYEPAMLDLTKRLIAIPSENPPGNDYKECARALCDEVDRPGFAEPTAHGTCGMSAS